LRKKEFKQNNNKYDIGQKNYGIRKKYGSGFLKIALQGRTHDICGVYYMKSDKKTFKRYKNKSVFADIGDKA